MVPERGNLADRIVQMAELARVKLKDTFSVNVDFDAKVMERLHSISALYETVEYKSPMNLSRGLRSASQSRNSALALNCGSHAKLLFNFR